MPETETAPRRRRLAKNKKKTWRTLSRDVDELLPQQTKLEVAKRRSGGFFLDVSSAGEKRAVDPSSGLRCHRILAPDCPPSRHSKQLKAFNERQLVKRAKRLQRAAGGEGQKPKQKQQKEKEESESATCAGAYDMWDCGSELRALRLPEDEHGLGHLLQYQLRATGRQPVRRRVAAKKAPLPACLVPQPGASYNPSLDDHQELLSSVESEELAKLRKEEKLHNQLERHFPDASVNLEADELQEMSAGLFDDGDAEKEEEEEEEEEKEEKKKEEAEGSQQQQRSRKSNLEAKRQRAEALERKRLRRMSHELGQLASVSKRVEASEEAARRRQEAKSAKRLLAASGTKRLGRQKFQEVEAQFQLPEELRPSLRQLRPEGDLFVDAVKGLQRRNVLEPRSRAKWRPRYPPKRYAKRNRAQLLPPPAS